MKTLGRYIWAKLGSCPRCTRTSFIYAIGSIAIAVAGSFFLPVIAMVSVAFCAAALTMLWLAHIIVYSLKMMARRTQSAQLAQPVISRRKLFGALAQIAAASIVASAVPGIAYAGNRKSKGHSKSGGCSSPDCPTCAPSCWGRGL